jgi:hypothetical protein
VLALVGLLAVDVWSQTQSGLGDSYYVTVWGLILGLAVWGPWFLIRAPSGERALCAMPIAVSCYLALSFVVSWGSPFLDDTRGWFHYALFVVASLVCGVGLAIAILSRTRRKTRESNEEDSKLIDSEIERRILA